jgi:hypothetical protein
MELTPSKIGNIGEAAVIWFTGWAVSHAVLNEWLQTSVLIVSLVAGILSIAKALKKKK